VTVYTTPVPTAFVPITTTPSTTFAVASSSALTSVHAKRSLADIEKSRLYSIGEPYQLEGAEGSTNVIRDVEERDEINGFDPSLISSACSCFATRPAAKTLYKTVTSQITLPITVATATSLSTTLTTTTLPTPTVTVSLACKSLPSNLPQILSNKHLQLNAKPSQWAPSASASAAAMACLRLLSCTTISPTRASRNAVQLVITRSTASRALCWVTELASCIS
jgi:hypothetical protein